MRKRSWLMVGVVAVVWLLAPAGQAAADPIGGTGTLQYTKLSPGTGEFTVYGYTGAIYNSEYSPLTSDLGGYVPSFQTFCLEYNEDAGTPVNYVINSAAVLGGEAVSDPLSMGTAYLYSQFAMGLLPDYFGGNRVFEAVSLQFAIWALENEPVASQADNPYYKLALQHGGTDDAPVGWYNVYVLNNTQQIATGAGVVRKQDFLWLSVPDGGTTLMLLGGALLGLGALRRKFNA